MCTACGVTRASLVRARAARALSEAAESRRAVAHVPGVRVYCTGCGAVRGASVSSCVVLWLFVDGALRRSTRKDGSLPSLRGGPHAVAAPANWTDLLGTRAESVPDCSSYLSRIPRNATDSGSSIHPRDSADRAAVSNFQPPPARLHALLNASAASESTASAASESTTAGGLEAFSQGSTGAERFENASSKFRWNPTPLFPFSKRLSMQQWHPGWLGQSPGF